MRRIINESPFWAEEIKHRLVKISVTAILTMWIVVCKEVQNKYLRQMANLPAAKLLP
jgi:hypothetical protein